MAHSTIIQMKESRGTHFWVPRLTLLASAGICLLHALGQPVFKWLVFDRQAVMHGQFWRVLTGHFVHVGLDHLGWDLLALLILGAIIEKKGAAAFWKSLLFSCSAVSFWLMLGRAETSQYCGLSGALSGLLAAAVFCRYEATRNKFFFVVLAAAALKIGLELVLRQPVFAMSVTPVPEAHLVGLGAGLFHSFSLIERNAFLPPKNGSAII